MNDSFWGIDKELCDQREDQRVMAIEDEQSKRLSFMVFIQDEQVKWDRINEEEEYNRRIYQATKGEAAAQTYLRQFYQHNW